MPIIGTKKMDILNLKNNNRILTFPFPHTWYVVNDGTFRQVVPIKSRYKAL